MTPAAPAHHGGSPPLLLLALLSYGPRRGAGDSPDPAHPGWSLTRERPDVLNRRHFRHLSEADPLPEVGARAGQLAHVGVPRLDAAVAGLHCSVKGILWLSIEDMDIHSARVDPVTGRYHYDIPGEEALAPGAASAVIGGCQALKRLYLALAAAAIDHGNACVTLGQACGALVAAVARARSKFQGRANATLGGPLAAWSGDTPVANSTEEVFGRHAAVLLHQLRGFEALTRVGGQVCARRLPSLVALVGERIKLFADNVGQAILLSLLPQMDPGHPTFQRVLDEITGAGLPRFVYSDLYGARWRVVASLLRGLGSGAGVRPGGLRVAEVGVEKGQTLLYIASRRSPRIGEYIGVDPYYAEGKGEELNAHLDGYHRNLTMAIAADHSQVVRLLRNTSEFASELFPDGYFDLVFIDADHEFLSVKRDIMLWRGKVRQGGLLVGHDFSMHHLAVVLAVLWECSEMPAREVHLATDTMWWSPVV